MEKHITILGALYIALGVLIVLAAIGVLLSVVGGGLLSGDAEAIAVTSGVGIGLAVFLLVIALPELIGGIGLIRRYSWSRILVLVLGCLNLLNFPLGTALGVYTLWALTRPEAKAALSR